MEVQLDAGGGMFRVVQPWFLDVRIANPVGYRE